MRPAFIFYLILNFTNSIIIIKKVNILKLLDFFILNYLQDVCKYKKICLWIYINKILIKRKREKFINFLSNKIDIVQKKRFHIAGFI